MDAVEFRPIAAAMLSRWYAFPIPPSALDQYVADLGSYAAAEVAAAVEAIAADGTDRPPTAGAIRRRIVEMRLDAPAWEDARLALVRWRAGRERRDALVEAWTCPYDECTGSGFVIEERVEVYKAMRDGEPHQYRARAEHSADCRCRPERSRVRAGLDELPPMVAEFVRERRVHPAELDRLIGSVDTSLEAQLRARWREFTSRAVDSAVLAGIGAGADLPRLEAARDEHAGRTERHGQPRRFSSAAVAGLLERGAA